MNELPVANLPMVVIAGRPNVGKSTLFNKLAGRRSAIVSDTPGVTRDRKDAEGLLRGRRVRLVDTAGLEDFAPDTMAGRMRASSETAVASADLILFVVDARAGLTPADRHFADWLPPPGPADPACRQQGRGPRRRLARARSLRARTRRATPGLGAYDDSSRQLCIGQEAFTACGYEPE